MAVSNLSNTQRVIRAAVIFFVSIFLFAATGSEIRDVAIDYCGWDISSRQALVLASFFWLMIQYVIAISSDVDREVYPEPVSAVLAGWVLLFALLLAEFPVLYNHLGFNNLYGVDYQTDWAPLRSVTNVLVAFVVFINGFLFAYGDYKNTGSSN